MKIIKLLFSITLFLSILISKDLDILNLKNGDLIKGKIVEYKVGEYIRIELQGGSILTFEYNEIDTVTKEKIEVQIPNTQSSTILPEGDCYQRGYFDGGSAPSGAFAGGLISGLFLGFIGWGITYAITTNSDPQPNYWVQNDADPNCEFRYRQGYKDAALKSRRTNVNMGGALGTAISFLIVTSTYSY